MLVPGIMVMGASVLSWVRTYAHDITQPCSVLLSLVAFFFFDVCAASAKQLTTHHVYLYLNDRWRASTTTRCYSLWAWAPPFTSPSRPWYVNDYRPDRRQGPCHALRLVSINPTPSQSQRPFHQQRDRITQAAKIWAERNAQRKRVIGDEESAEWINTVLYRFWQFYEPGALVWFICGGRGARSEE